MQAQWVDAEVDPIGSTNEEWKKASVRYGIDPLGFQIIGNAGRTLGSLGLNTATNFLLGDDLGRAAATGLTQTATGRLLGELAFRSVNPLNYKTKVAAEAVAMIRSIPASIVGNYLGGYGYDRIFPEGVEAAQAQQIVNRHDAAMNGNPINDYLANTQKLVWM